MGFLTKILNSAADDDFTLARDLIAMAYADGKVTAEEQTAVTKLCQKEDISQVFYEEFNLPAKYIPNNMPQSKKDKETYLVKMIQVMGADANSSTEEIFLLEIMAERLGFNKFQLISVVLQNTNRRLFPGDYGSKILSSFMNNIIDVRGKSDKQNHDNIAKLFNAVAENTPTSPDPEENVSILRKALSQAIKTLLNNKIQIDEFRKAGLDFKETLEYEAEKAFKKWIVI